MKCVILAGGYAKRLWPITLRRAKPLLPVAGKPIIDYVLESLRRAGVDEVIVSTNAAFEDQFREWSRGKRVSVIVEKTTSESNKLGSLGALAYVFEQAGVDDDCLVIGGDNLLTFELKDFVQAFRGEALVALYDMNDVERVRNRYGVVVLDGDVVKGFQEKPSDPKSTLVSTACYLYPKSVVSMLGQYLREGNSPDSPGFFLEWLHRRVSVRGFVFEGRWYDIGDLRSYIEVNKDYGAVMVSPLAVVENSSLRDTLVLGSARIVDSSLSGCVVDEGAELVGVKLRDSLIGANDSLHGAPCECRH
ncbi:MAG: nucleotidyltransferase family protein [Candidatus Diapherotrites archaeon]|nr:nucleotidyltransferase family protein [Candidatus Diapherotrites archaeon]